MGIYSGKHLQFNTGGLVQLQKNYFRSKYDSIGARRGKKKALIAVGHKIRILTNSH